jgi:hypothetical protein
MSILPVLFVIGQYTNDKETLDLFPPLEREFIFMQLDKGRVEVTLPDLPFLFPFLVMKG